MNNMTLAFSAAGLWLSLVVPISGMIWAFYSVTTSDRNQMFSLWKENQERWISTQLEIKEILLRMERSGK